MECAAADLAAGRTRTTTISAGERAVVSVRHGQEWEITREKFSAGDIDGFVMDELKQDPELCAKILEASGLDILGTGGGSATASGDAGNGLTWSLSNGTLTISGTGEMSDYMSSINPSPWYDYREQIHTVSIGNGVTRIGHSAFHGCTNLTSVSIPNSVTAIKPNAFTSCRDLTSVTIPDSVTDIGNAAFSYSGLTSVTIPNGVTVITGTMFAGCRDLTSVTIPNGVTRIEDDAFRACTSLTSVTIPASVTSIGFGAMDIPGSFWGAFYQCDSLKDIYYGGSTSQWGQIKINENDAPLLSTATIHYNS